MKTRLLTTLFLLVFSFLPVASRAADNLNNQSYRSYWIDKLPSPDAVLLEPPEIESFNRAAVDNDNQMADISAMPDKVSRETLIAWLNHDPLVEPSSTARYDLRGAKVHKRFFKTVVDNENLSGLNRPSPFPLPLRGEGDAVAARYGVIIERADIRAHPTDAALLKYPSAKGFDTLQYSSIFPATPVALLHTSKDKKWGFFQTPFVRGWIKLNKVVFGEREDIFRQGAGFVVVTGSSVNVFADMKRRKTLASMPMGASLTLEENSDNDRFWIVRYPVNDKGALKWIKAYVDKAADAHKGFLPYTSGNVVRQAFKMIGERYGWGGAGGRRDCSEFIRNTFATMGVQLPRHSQKQAASGVVKTDGVDYDGHLVKLEHVRPGITLITTDRHVMLYLGEKDGAAHVIHQTSGYWDGKRKRKLNRVAVTAIGNTPGVDVWPIAGKIKAITEILSAGKG
ncbi:MAG: SH3 domain-containing protein [Deltaproteobacteria bacterium]|nr:SH3 domain-containing protein [Deltaproteobacteria bacterium]